MTISERLLSVRAGFDFFLRSCIRLRVPIHGLGTEAPRFEQLQREIGDFLKPANVDFHSTKSVLQVLDVGAKDFFAGPAIDQWLADKGYRAQIHGIELDAFRRLTNLRTREDYGHYFAKQMRDGHFVAGDFLEWSAPANLILLLNPFVTKEPLLRWGLPLRHFKPRQLFEHCAKLLTPSRGILLTSTPSKQECKLVEEQAIAVGFRPDQRWQWQPQQQGAADKPTTVQQKPRYGATYRWV